jgi:hypothetical protein
MRPCTKCGGPDPSGRVNEYCLDCAELLAKVYLTWNASSFKESMNFVEFFRKMLDTK